MSKPRRRTAIQLYVDLVLFEERERLRREGATPEAIEALLRAIGIGTSPLDDLPGRTTQGVSKTVH